jgi:hypothetical protein
LLVLAASWAVAGDIDATTQQRATDGYAAEIFGMMSHWVKDELLHEQLTEEQLDALAVRSTRQVSHCVVSILSKDPDDDTRAFVYALADLGVDDTAAEIVRRQYASPEMEGVVEHINQAAEACMAALSNKLGLSVNGTTPPDAPGDQTGPGEDPTPGDYDLVYETDPETGQIPPPRD